MIFMLVEGLFLYKRPVHSIYTGYTHDINNLRTNLYTVVRRKVCPRICFPNLYRVANKLYQRYTQVIHRVILSMFHVKHCWENGSV